MASVVFICANMSNFYNVGKMEISYSIVDPEDTKNFRSIVVEDFDGLAKLYDELRVSMDRYPEFWRSLEQAAVILTDSDTTRLMFATIYPTKQVHYYNAVFGENSSVAGRANFGEISPKLFCHHMVLNTIYKMFRESTFFTNVLTYNVDTKTPGYILDISQDDSETTLCESDLSALMLESNTNGGLKKRPNSEDEDEDTDSNDEMNFTFYNLGTKKQKIDYDDEVATCSTNIF